MVHGEWYRHWRVTSWRDRHGGNIQSGIFRGESTGGESTGPPSGGSLHEKARHTTRPVTCAQANVANSYHVGSSSVDSGEVMRNRIRRLEKMVDTLQSTCSEYRNKLCISSVDSSHGATDVHNMPWSASLLMGAEERNELGVVPTSRLQVVDRSAGTRVVVTEPLEAGSISAGVGPAVATLTVDSPTSETRDQVRAVADVSTTQESSSGGTSQVSGTARVPVSKLLKLEKYNPDKIISNFHGECCQCEEIQLMDRG